VALILLAASATLSAQVSVVAPAFGTVRAGETVRIEWKALPGGVEELELLLTMEGRELPIRVTPQLVARAGVLLWRVPNLPSRSARLTVRYGLDGEEVEGRSSAPFEILPAENQAPAVLLFRQGEWWAQVSAEDRFPGALKTREDGDRIEEDREGPACSASSQIVPAPPRSAAQNEEAETCARALAPARPVLMRRPMEVPARI